MEPRTEERRSSQSSHRWRPAPWSEACCWAAASSVEETEPGHGKSGKSWKLSDLTWSGCKISTCVKCRRRRRREVCRKNVQCLSPLPPVMRNLIKLQDKWSPRRIPVNASAGEICLICFMMVGNGIIKSILSLTNKYNSARETVRCWQGCHQFHLGSCSGFWNIFFWCGASCQIILCDRWSPVLTPPDNLPALRGTLHPFLCSDIIITSSASPQPSNTK